MSLVEIVVRAHYVGGKTVEGTVKNDCSELHRIWNFLSETRKQGTCSKIPKFLL